MEDKEGQSQYQLQLQQVGKNQNQHKRQEPETPKKKRIAGHQKHGLLKTEEIKKVFPTPEFTPASKAGTSASMGNLQLSQHAHTLITPSKKIIHPRFVGKRSFDIFADTELHNNENQDNNENIIQRDSKRIKISLGTLTDDEDDEEGQTNEDEFDDNDSEASTEVASQVDGHFYQISTRSDNEHVRTSFRQTMDSCLTPEHPIDNFDESFSNCPDSDEEFGVPFSLSKRKINSNDSISLNHFPNINEAESRHELPSTPKSKIGKIAEFNRNDKLSFALRNAEVLKQYNSKEDILLIDHYGKKSIKKMKGFKNPQINKRQTVRDKLFKAKEAYNDEYPTDDDESDGSIEARLIREADERDKQQGYCQTTDSEEEDAYTDANVDSKESLRNYFNKMQTRRRLESTVNAAISSHPASRKLFYDLPASGVNVSYDYRYDNDSSEEEEAYLRQLLNKHKARAAAAPGTSPQFSFDVANDTGVKGEPVVPSASVFPSIPSSSQKSSDRTAERLRNKRLMRQDDEENDNYLNFGFTLSDLSSLHNRKRILVFEDPKSDDSAENSQNNADKGCSD